MKMLLAVERAKFTFPAQHRGCRQFQVVAAGNRVFLTNQLALVQKATRSPLPHPFSYFTFACEEFGAAEQPQVLSSEECSVPGCSGNRTPKALLKKSKETRMLNYLCQDKNAIKNGEAH